MCIYNIIYIPITISIEIDKNSGRITNVTSFIPPSKRKDALYPFLNCFGFFFFFYSEHFLLLDSKNQRNQNIILNRRENVLVLSASCKEFHLPNSSVLLKTCIKGIHTDFRHNNSFKDHLTLQFQVTVNWMRTRKPGKKKKKVEKKKHFWKFQMQECMEGNT